MNKNAFLNYMFQFFDLKIYLKKFDFRKNISKFRKHKKIFRNNFEISKTNTRTNYLLHQLVIKNMF